MIFRRHIQSLSDEELLREYRGKGDPLILGELYRRYGHLVFGVALKYLRDREEASDVTLAVFEKLSQILRNAEVKQFSSWLYQVARNQCLMVLRSKGRYVKRLEDYRREISEDQTFKAEDSDDTSDQIGRVEKALNDLEEKQRKCLTMFYLDEKSYREISFATGFSESMVKSHIQNGRRRLRLMLTGIR